MVDERMSNIIKAFIFIVVGIALLAAIADQVFITNNPEIAVDEEVAITAAMATPKNLSTGNVTYQESVVISLDNDKLFTLDSVRVNTTALVRDTDFTLDIVAGTFTLLNSSTTLTLNWTDNVANFTTWNYTFGDNFVQDATSRVFLNLIPLFFVIGLLLFIIAVVFFRDQLLDLFNRK